MEIDIRKLQEPLIQQIRFYDEDGDFEYATKLKLYDDGFNIVSDSDSHMKIIDKQHALDLIKAIDKAISLGWVV